MVLFPHLQPHDIARNPLLNLNSHLKEYNEIIIEVVGCYYLLGKIEEIEFYLTKNPLNEQYSSLDGIRDWFSLCKFYGLLDSKNLDLINKYLVPFLNELYERTKPHDGYSSSQASNNISCLCSCEVYSKIAATATLSDSEIRMGIAIIHMRFPDEFDKYFNRKQIVDALSSSPIKDLASLCTISALDDCKHEYDDVYPLLIERLSKAINEYNKSTDIIRTCLNQEILLLVNTCNKLLKYNTFLLHAIKAEFIQTLTNDLGSAVSETKVFSDELRTKLANLLHSIIISTNEVPAMKTQVQEHLGKDYLFYKNLNTTSNNILFFASNSTNVPTTVNSYQNNFTQ
ncbi:MAG: hypothetical protein WC627_01375 [Legionella sp.]